MSFENTGKPWSEDEDKQLINEYNLGITINEICKTHKREKGAISSRLRKLNLNSDLSHKKEKKLSDNQREYIILQNNVKEIKQDIKDLQESVKNLTDMLKAIYDFEDTK
jgi:hypothetical protein